MSEHSFLREQSIGTQFSGVYYVSAVSIKKAKNNNEYTEYTLKDKSGTVFAKLWAVDPLIKKGMYASIVLNVDDYNGQASYVVRSIKAYEKEVDTKNYIAVVDDMESLIQSFNSFMSSVEEISEDKKLPYFKLLTKVFTNEFKEKFFRAPSNMGSYYGKVGGALENTINICRESLTFIKGSYGFTDTEKAVILTSALLSRIGCVQAYTLNNCAVEKTMAGELIGTHYLAANILNDAVNGMLNKDNETQLTKIIHAVTSFEGTENIPVTKEAILLKSVMEIDNKMSEMFDYIYRDEHVDDNGFTTYDSNNKRRYFVK